MTWKPPETWWLILLRSYKVVCVDEANAAMVIDALSMPFTQLSRVIVTDLYGAKVHIMLSSVDAVSESGDDIKQNIEIHDRHLESLMVRPDDENEWPPLEVAAMSESLRHPLETSHSARVAHPYRRNDDTGNVEFWWVYTACWCISIVPESIPRGVEVVSYDDTWCEPLDSLL